MASSIALYLIPWHRVSQLNTDWLLTLRVLSSHLHVLGWQAAHHTHWLLHVIWDLNCCLHTCVHALWPLNHAQCPSQQSFQLLDSSPVGPFHNKPKHLCIFGSFLMVLTYWVFWKLLAVFQAPTIMERLVYNSWHMETIYLSVWEFFLSFFLTLEIGFLIAIGMIITRSQAI